MYVILIFCFWGYSDPPVIRYRNVIEHTDSLNIEQSWNYYHVGSFIIIVDGKQIFRKNGLIKCPKSLKESDISTICT